MMNHGLAKILSFLSGPLVLITMAVFWMGADEKDYSECIKKYAFSWGTACTNCPPNSDTYRVLLKNNCTETVDVKCAVQEKDKRWRTFQFLKIAGNDTIVAYACQGVGKHLVWAKKTGDASNTFPTDEEINAQFK